MRRFAQPFNNERSGTMKQFPLLILFTSFVYKVQASSHSNLAIKALTKTLPFMKRSHLIQSNVRDRTLSSCFTTP